MFDQGTGRLNSNPPYARALSDCVNGQLGPSFTDPNGTNHRLQNPALDEFPSPSYLYFRLQNKEGNALKAAIKRVSVFMKYNHTYDPPPVFSPSKYTWTLRGSNGPYKGDGHGSTLSWTPIAVVEQQVHAHSADSSIATTDAPFCTKTIVDQEGNPVYDFSPPRHGYSAWARYDIITENNTEFEFYHVGVSPAIRNTGVSLCEILLN